MSWIQTPFQTQCVSIQAQSFNPHFAFSPRLCGRGCKGFCQWYCGAGYTRVQVLQLCCHSEEIWKHTVSLVPNLSALLHQSLKIHSDTEHSISWQPWWKCITMHEQMRDQGSVCKLWCMVVLNAPLAFSLHILLPSRGNCLGFLFINQKVKVDLASFFPPIFFFFFSVLSHRAMCDERALLMWSCRDPFLCQQHRFLHRTLSDEFACFGFSLCVLIYVIQPNYMCESIFLSLFTCFCVLGACHVWPVLGDASGM